VDRRIFEQPTMELGSSLRILDWRTDGERWPSGKAKPQSCSSARSRSKMMRTRMFMLHSMPGPVMMASLIPLVQIAAERDQPDQVDCVEIAGLGPRARRSTPADAHRKPA